MAFIKPFRGLRPPRDLAEKVASLPYDVMDTEEAREMAAGNPYSFLHVSRPEIDLAPDVDPHDDIVHDKGKANLEKLVGDGVLVQDPQECYYVYRQRMGAVVQTGLVACAGVDDYRSGVIRKHELTRADKEEDRVKHIERLDANDEPVFYTYRACPAITAIVAGVAAGEPEYDFTTADGVGHTFWVIRERAAIDRLTALFAAIPTLYVADGHHRSAAASRVADIRAAANPLHDGSEEYNSFLTVIFPDAEMNIMAYNRAVRDLNGLDAAAFIDAVSAKFTVTPTETAVAPQRRHLFGMYLDGKWYTLAAREEIVDEGDSVGRLDVSILQSNLLAPVLGIENPRTDRRIHFVGGIRGLAELERIVDSGEYRVAFSLHPTSMEELMALSDEDKIMPPKSTWFEPKLRSGLVVHSLKEAGK